MAIRIGKYLYPGFMLVGGQGNSGVPLVADLTVVTNETFNGITLAVQNGQDFTIDWGDGNSETHTGDDGDHTYTHTYVDAGSYTISVFGAVIGFNTDPLEYALSVSGTSSTLNNLDLRHAGAMQSLNVGGFSVVSGIRLEQFGSMPTINGTSNIASVVELYIANTSIASIDTSTWTLLETVYISECPLSSFDTTNNTAITDLAIISTGLATLNTSGLGNCISLQLDTGNVTTIDLSPLITAQGVEITAMPITSIDVSFLVSCTTLFVRSTDITVIDVSDLLQLETFDISDNLLSAVDVSINTSLQTLNVSLNTIATLDISTNTALTYVDCSGNQLTTLDITTNTLLTNLVAENNQLSVTEVSNILIALDAAGLSNGNAVLMQTPPAIPDAGGQTAATNLIGKGWTVSIDS